MLLDTGAVGAVTIYAQFQKLHPGLVPAHWVALTAGAILPGQFVTKVGRLDQVRVGRLLVPEPVTNFSANADADDAAPGDAGLIGGQILSRYRVTIDYARKRAVLAPARRANDSYEFDASGLSLVAEYPTFKSKKVRLVLPGSPAATAGIKAGDQLLAIDDRPVSDTSLAELRMMLRLSGKTYLLRIRRGDEQILVSLITRRLI
jgi:membrane-associated protease RseP (regulator of RpoE activity)